MASWRERLCVAALGVAGVLAAVPGQAAQIDVALAENYFQATSDFTELMVASLDGRLDAVQSLLAAKADVNGANGNRVTSLMLASRNGHLDVVKALLAARADVNAKAVNGATALMLASQNGNVEVVKVLLAARANANATNAFGATALIFAVSATGASTSGLTFDVTQGVPIKTAKGSDRQAVVEALLAAGAEVNAKTRDGTTALSLAATNSDDQVTALLRQNGAQTSPPPSRPDEILRERPRFGR